MNMEKDRKKQLILEIIRFLIVGGVATVFDFGAKTLVAYLLPTSGFSTFLHFTIPLICGFIVGVLVNYFLSIIWVFQNVENKEKTKTKKSECENALRSKKLFKSSRDSLKNLLAIKWFYDVVLSTEKK